MFSTCCFLKRRKMEAAGVLVITGESEERISPIFHHAIWNNRWYRRMEERKSSDEGYGVMGSWSHTAHDKDCTFIWEWFKVRYAGYHTTPTGSELKVQPIRWIFDRMQNVHFTQKLQKKKCVYVMNLQWCATLIKRKTEIVNCVPGA